MKLYRFKLYDFTTILYGQKCKEGQIDVYFIERADGTRYSYRFGVQWAELIYDDEQVGNVAKPNACAQLCEVRELIKKIEEWQDVVSTFELDLMERDTVNVMTDIIRLKNSIKEKL